MKIPKDMKKGTIFTTNNFGDLQIVNYETALVVHIIFCSTKYTCIAKASNIRRGFVRDPYKPFLAGVGYTGVGKYMYTKNGKYKKAYSIWSGMIKRCYSKNEQKYCPTYKECTVCKEWHNFQLFAEWFIENYRPNTHLDKDILIEGNKEYSPKTCIFIDQKSNNQKAKARYFTLINPEGNECRVYNLEKFCRKHKLQSASLRQVRAGKRKHCSSWILKSYGELNYGGE